MSNFLNYVDRWYTFYDSNGRSPGEIVYAPKEKTLVVDGCSMVQAYDDSRMDDGDIGSYFAKKCC